MEMKHIYLIINPATESNTLLSKLHSALQENLYAVQIWDNFHHEIHIQEIVPKIIEICQKQNTPVFINNRWQLSEQYPFAGVHFDEVPQNWQTLQHQLPSHLKIGITANNDLQVVHWAEKQQACYISFCSMFPSQTANSCELVKFETIQQAKKISSLPIFLAGGILPERLSTLNTIKEYFDGIALISGVMNNPNPQEAIRNYKTILQTW